MNYLLPVEVIVKTAFIAFCALLATLVSNAAAQSYVEISGNSRLTVMPAAYGVQDA